jgi:hypothetical protein
MIVGRVTGQANEIYGDGDTPVSTLQVEMSEEDDVQSVEYYRIPGIDSNPLEDSSVVVGDISDAWRVSLGVDDRVIQERDPGEIEIYSSATVGVAAVKKAAVRCLADGTIELEVLDPSAGVSIKALGGAIAVENSAGKFELTAAGQFNANGNFTVDP